MLGIECYQYPICISCGYLLKHGYVTLMGIAHMTGSIQFATIGILSYWCICNAHESTSKPNIGCVAQFNLIQLLSELKENKEWHIHIKKHIFHYQQGNIHTRDVKNASVIMNRMTLQYTTSN